MSPWLITVEELENSGSFFCLPLTFESAFLMMCCLPGFLVTLSVALIGWCFDVAAAS